MEKKRREYALRVAPKPAMLCRTEPSFTTMSASPMAPLVTKLIGLEPRLVYVKRLDLSQVVAHWEGKRRYQSLTRLAKEDAVQCRIFVVQWRQALQ